MVFDLATLVGKESAQVGMILIHLLRKNAMYFSNLGHFLLVAHVAQIRLALLCFQLD